MSCIEGFILILDERRDNKRVTEKKKERKKERRVFVLILDLLPRVFPQAIVSYEAK